jgi:hypothetical protein
MIDRDHIHAARWPTERAIGGFDVPYRLVP